MERLAPSSTKSTKFSQDYPSYFNKPIWHSQVISKMEKGLDKQKGNAGTLEMYKSLFQGLNPITSKAQKKIEIAKKMIESRKKVRKLKPLSIEYIHLKKYKQTLNDPTQKQKFFTSEADAADNILIQSELIRTRKLEQTKQAINFTDGFQSRTFSKDQQFLGRAKDSNIKTIADFDADLKTQKHQSGLLVSTYF